MPKSSLSDPGGGKSPRSSSSQTDNDRYAYLRAEAKAPYRVLRRFIYVAFGASGFIGALVFLAQLLTLQNMRSNIPNLGLQLGVLALMIWLLKVDRAR